MKFPFALVRPTTLFYRRNKNFGIIGLNDCREMFRPKIKFLEQQCLDSQLWSRHADWNIRFTRVDIALKRWRQTKQVMHRE